MTVVMLLPVGVQSGQTVEEFVQDAQSANDQLPMYRFEVGQRLLYRVEFDSRATADMNALFKGQQQQTPQSTSNLSYDLAASLHGQLEIAVVKVNSDLVEAFYTFREPTVRIVINGQKQIAQEGAVTGELTRGFLVRLTPAGGITAVYINVGAEKFSQDFIRTLLAAFQFVLPEKSSSENLSWRVHEEDRNGAYIAQYRALPGVQSTHPGWVMLQKTKLRYLPAPAQPGQDQLPGRTQAHKTVVPKMTIEARFDLSQGALLSLDGKEFQKIAIEGQEVASSQIALHMARTSGLRLSGREQAEVNQKAAALKTNAPALALFIKPSPHEIESNIQRTELGSATLEELLAALTSADAGKAAGTEAAETSLYLKFKAVVFLDPGSCDELGKILSRANASSLSFRVLARALGSVGHREAQEALVAAIRARSSDWPALSNLVATIGALPQPTLDSEKAVQELTTSSDRNIAATALLALGAMSHNLVRAKPARAKKIIRDLEQRLSQSPSAESTIQLIQALGNTADSSALATLAPFVNDHAPSIRAAALDAVRSIPLARVDAVLTHALSSDPDPKVRLEAAFALGFRKAGDKSFATQEKALLTDSDEKVRGAVINNLAKMQKQFPTVRRLIQQAAENDASEYVRETAAGVLQIMTQASNQ
jgi:HEAT repeat protein